MHLPSEWTEFGDLCDSKPFQLFCASPLPTSEQQLICRACGHPVDESGHHHHQLHVRDHIHTDIQYDQDPEAAWIAEGRPEWTAPYVWETNY